MTRLDSTLASAQRTQIDAWLSKNGKALGALTSQDVTRLGRSVGLDAAGRAEVRRMVEAAREGGIDTVERLAAQQPANGRAANAAAPIDASKIPESSKKLLRELWARLNQEEPLPAPPPPPPPGPSAEELAKKARLKALKASPLFRSGDNLAHHWKALPEADRMFLVQNLVFYPSLKLLGSKVTESPMVPYDAKSKTQEQKAAKLVLEAFPELEIQGDYHEIGPLLTQVEGLYDERGGMLGGFVTVLQPVCYAEDGPPRKFKTEAEARKAGVDIDLSQYHASFRILAYVEFTSGAVKGQNRDGDWHYDH